MAKVERTVNVIFHPFGDDSPRTRQQRAQALVQKALHPDQPLADFVEEEETKQRGAARNSLAEAYHRALPWLHKSFPRMAFRGRNTSLRDCLAVDFWCLDCEYPSEPKACEFDAAIEDAVCGGSRIIEYTMREAVAAHIKCGHHAVPTQPYPTSHASITKDSSSEGFPRFTELHTKDLEQKLDAARADAERYKQDHLRACETIAKMHAAAVGEVRGPKRGVVEDVAHLRESFEMVGKGLAHAVRERDELRAQLDRISKERRSTESTVLVDVQDID